MKLKYPETLELSIIMPCLNEAAALPYCIRQALAFMRRRGINGEIIVADNASTDGSASVAAALKARVIKEPRRGYGRALRAGIAAARGSVIIFGDCDTTYDFYRLDSIYDPLAKRTASLHDCGNNKINNAAALSGFDIMTGDRLRSGFERGAMPFTHLLGVQFLSALGRLRYGVSIHDFHCGLRGLTREAALSMELNSTGMEFATEFIAEAQKKGLSIGETPITLRRARAARKSKLRPVSDGLRHIKFMLTGSSISSTLPGTSIAK